MFEITDEPDKPKRFKIGDILQIVDVSPTFAADKCPYQLGDILTVTNVNIAGLVAFFGTDFYWKPSRFRAVRK